MSNKTTKSGRPKGAKNIDRPAVVAVPPACPMAQGGCGSTSAEVLRIASVLDFAGTLPNGQAYNRITVKRVRCRDCGIQYLTRLYELVPPKK